MMVIDRASGTIEHRQFAEFPDFVRKNDLLVMNDTRVQGNDSKSDVPSILENRQGRLSKSAKRAARELSNSITRRMMIPTAISRCLHTLIVLTVRRIAIATRLSMPRRRGLSRRLLLGCISQRK
jgi:hypothetical protein